ncbi:MAG: holo-ACP synthase [Pelagibacteraceae bacterium]|jgi:holo-[acyl-carrier protein] synthase|nr:holo-ACP synthase [Pelagibacteraceae bacterium]|tara:strand:- start:3095 stop:3475 length:381 start_codon:yes stop_codon:yes gene_type:complete
MSIIGLGNDIVNIKRVEKILLKNKKNFIKKIFNSKEIISSKISAEYVSKRFAAKEAFAKAIGTGIGKTIKFNEIIITNNKYGAPGISLEKNVEKRVLKKLKVKRIKYFLSLSDDYPFALATVIIST